MTCGNCGRSHDAPLGCGCIPAEFWTRSEVAAALTPPGDVGTVVRLLRAHTDLTQEAIGNLAGLSQSAVSRLKSGRRTITNPAKTTEILKRMGTPGSTFPSLRGGFLLGTQLSSPSPEELPGPEDYELSTGKALQDAVSEGSDTEAVQAFRLADRQVGGGYLYTAVLDYLKTRVGPHLVSEISGQKAFTAAAGLTEMAGWMAHDAGRDHIADRHFQRALRLAQVGGIEALSVQVLASHSHLALHRGQPQEAAAYVEQGVQALSGTEATSVPRTLSSARGPDTRASRRLGHRGASERRYASTSDATGGVEVGAG